ncbi:cupin domain-containing protein [Lactonifactor sp. BIOML-A3]|uniref:cupin domain-containing protein n=1 Tax=Lactonifactor TaxID=420345 RepID=UPI0012B109E1|nr:MULTISPECIES: cupin domain-containing protein [Lactonifactor]MCB5713843.1 cupin domain-containing protein [Lactonifactor longoviformis]MCB5717865.1 cupin domain-containing protein [Lactonifactor longoviformis]MSA01612.1 cupin domain-containing protein [Lactonifactor sp. BIOML-A5]MSA07832.1 cupin domain-containing protein [Lactonifactor sp. BIOML-A4]MSA12449.1 cupin domain-containing protein [Lactonifactor sp. BIOML-A3]
MKIVKKADAKVSLDGPEVVRDYCRTDKIWFGTSELLPGQTGGVDPGHPISHETFFACRGHVVVRNGQSGKCYELQEGDLLLIEEGEPHEITNIGSEPALISWCGGPVD